MASDSKERMIRSAYALFRVRGYSGTGFRDINAHSGVPRGAIYHHFPGGKSELAEDVIRLADREVGDALEMAFTQQLDPISTLAAFVAGWTHPNSPMPPPKHSSVGRRSSRLRCGAKARRHTARGVSRRSRSRPWRAQSYSAAPHVRHNPSTRSDTNYGKRSRTRCPLDHQRAIELRPDRPQLSVSPAPGTWLSNRRRTSEHEWATDQRRARRYQVPANAASTSTANATTHGQAPYRCTQPANTPCTRPAAAITPSRGDVIAAAVVANSRTS